MNSIKLNNSQKEIFGEKFLDVYLQRGFGSMNKNDFEVLIFHLLRETYGKDKRMSNYQWSLDLHIPETKVRKLSYEADLIYQIHDAEQLKQSFFAILDKNISKFSSDGKKIQFVIEDKSLRTMLSADLKKLGYFADSSFNSEIVSVDLEAFSALLIEYYPKSFNVQLEQKYMSLKTANTTKIDKVAILQKFLEGIAKGTGEIIPTVIKDIALAYTNPANLVARLIEFINLNLIV